VCDRVENHEEIQVERIQAHEHTSRRLVAG
jgi:hypothetical protein